MASPQERGVSGGRPPGSLSRRGLLRTAGVSAAVVGGGGLLEACSSSIKGASGGSTSTTGGGGTKDIVIGFIHPLTGHIYVLTERSVHLSLVLLIIFILD